MILNVGNIFFWKRTCSKIIELYFLTFVPCKSVEDCICTRIIRLIARPNGVFENTETVTNFFRKIRDLTHGITLFILFETKKKYEKSKNKVRKGKNEGIAPCLYNIY